MWVEDGKDRCSAASKAKMNDDAGGDSNTASEFIELPLSVLSSTTTSRAEIAYVLKCERKAYDVCV